MSIDPANLTAQLHHRAAGNPPSTLPDSAVSNCFPGLEFDIRNIWRRIFEGIVLHEASGFVVSAEGEHAALQGQHLVEIDGTPIRVAFHGPTDVADDAPLGSDFLEWSNALADVMANSVGDTVGCRFLDFRVNPPRARTAQLTVRPLFAEGLALIEESIARPGELTQSLCSPWQNDYRECACYYWAASRPDFVNREAAADGTTEGSNWMARVPRSRDYDTPNQLDYVDLFRNWQGLLRFVVGGRDQTPG